jgi:Family of unknown function (DUF6364)
MTVKLTLSVTPEVIEKAKVTARRRKTSVSKLVEEYLRKISEVKEGSVTQEIIAHAPVKKTKPGTEKKILKQKLGAKYGY